jgi:TolB-like protein
LNRRITQTLATLFLLAGGVLPTRLLASGSQGVQAPSQSMTRLLETVSKRALEVAATRKIRLAVIPVKGTESPRYADKGFGAYLTEKISSSLLIPNSPIRLFERTRLDAVLKEQALSASGVFDESEARKIGELAPIDYILTGTFTRLEQSIAVNLRFIDVVSGEVRGQLSEHLDLTADLAALFEDLQTRPVPTAPCEPKWGPVKALMEDIGTPAKLDRLVEAATAIPFEPPCGDIHYSVIALLSRYKQSPPRYSQFLLQTLQRLENPDGDDRDGAIIKYLLSPGQLDDPAWHATLRVAGLSKRFSGYLDALLADKLGTDASRRRLQERIGIILDQVEQKRLGRPVPLESGKTFLEVLGTLKSNFLGGFVKTKDLRPLLSCYQTYGPKYIQEPDKKLLEILAAMYDAAETGKDRERILDWLCERINQVPPSRELEDVLVGFLRKLFEGRKAGAGIPARDLQRMADLCGQRIAETIPFILGRDYRLEVTAFCLEHGIKAPGIVPDLEALGRDLASADDTTQREAIRLLKALGPAALPLEPAVLKQLRRTESKGDWDGRNKYLQHDLLGLLGTLQTRNPEAHRLLFHQLLSLESYVADEAILALVSIGEPAATLLKSEFPGIEEAYKQMRVLKVFQLRGKAAALHLPWLKAILESTRSPHVRDAAEDAIDAIAKS